MTLTNCGGIRIRYPVDNWGPAESYSFRLSVRHSSALVLLEMYGGCFETQANPPPRAGVRQLAALFIVLKGDPVAGSGVCPPENFLILICCR